MLGGGKGRAGIFDASDEGLVCGLKLAPPSETVMASAR